MENPFDDENSKSIHLKKESKGLSNVKDIMSMIQATRDASSAHRRRRNRTRRHSPEETSTGNDYKPAPPKPNQNIFGDKLFNDDALNELIQGFDTINEIAEEKNQIFEFIKEAEQILSKMTSAKLKAIESFAKVQVDSKNKLMSDLKEASPKSQVDILSDLFKEELEQNINDFASLAQ